MKMKRIKRIISSDAFKVTVFIVLTIIVSEIINIFKPPTNKELEAYGAVRAEEAYQDGYEDGYSDGLFIKDSALDHACIALEMLENPDSYTIDEVYYEIVEVVEFLGR